jgi:NB-ARC domain/Effector-associated domain 4/APAF-1 helical domain
MAIKRNNSHGPDVQSKVKRVLVSILDYADGMINDSQKSKPMVCRWSDDGRLAVNDATVNIILHRINFENVPVQMNAEDVKRAFGDLEELQIFTDRRGSKKQGVTHWQFDLKFGSQERQAVLAEFARLWESKWPLERKQNAVAKEWRKSAPKQSKLLHNVPPLAPSQKYVARPKVLAEVKQKLLVQNSQPLVIRGLGGLGKSILAAAIARDEEILKHFQDGVLWVTLGQNPTNLQADLGGWIQVLDKSTERYSASTLNLAKSYLQNLLLDKHVLIVIDNVWNAAHAEWFQVGGAGCRVLVTTRAAFIPNEETYRLPLMDLNESVALMKGELGQKWHDSLEKQIREFAELLGCLPFAMKLMAVQVLRGRDLELLKTAFFHETKRLSTLDYPEMKLEDLSEDQRREYSLRACLGLSLKWLDAPLLKQFTWLGVLQEDISIQRKMAMTLWDVEEWEAEASLLSLYESSLLMEGVETLEGERIYRVHDLLHHLAQELIGHSIDHQSLQCEKSEIDALPGLGLTLPQAHEQLLERYQKQIYDQRWDKLPNDGYVHGYLTWHMEQAEQTDEIHALMAMSDERGRNAWFEACEQIGQPAYFVQDLALGWRLAEKIYEREPEKSIILQVRYALTQATTKSAVNNISPELLSALVKYGFWSEKRAWEFIESRDNVLIQAFALEALIPYLSKPLLKKSLTTIENMAEKKTQAKCFVALAKIKPEYIQEAYDVIQEIQGFQDFYERAMLLSELSKNCPIYFDKTLEQANNIPDNFQKAVAFIEMLPRKKSLLGKIFKLAAGLTQDDYHSLSSAKQQLRRDDQAILYSKIINHRPDLLDQALIGARETQYQHTKTLILTNLVQYDKNILDETLTSIENLQGGYLKSINLVKLAEYDLKFLSDALASGQQIEDEFEQALLLAGLIEYGFDYFDDAKKKARQIKDAYKQAFALSKLVSQSSEIFDEALTVAKKVEDEHLHASILVDLSELTKSSSQRIELLEKALSLADSSQWEHRKGLILRDLSKQKLSEDLLERIRQSARAIKDPVEKAKTLAALSKYDSLIVNEVLELVNLIENQHKLIKDTNELSSSMMQYESFIILSILAENQSELFPRVEELAYKIQDPTYYALALCELSEIESSFFEKALDAISHLPASWTQADAFISLYWYAPNSLVLKVWNAIESIISTDDRARAYSSTILVHLSPEDYLFSIWKHILHLIAHRRRTELLEDIVKLIPVIQHFGGENSIKGIAKAMQEVCGQWK